MFINEPKDLSSRVFNFAILKKLRKSRKQSRENQKQYGTSFFLIRGDWGQVSATGVSMGTEDT